MKAKSFISVFIIWGILLAVTKNVFSKDIDRIVAVVNDELILYSDLRSKIKEIKEKLNPPVAIPEAELERQVLMQMVEDKLIRQAMKNLKINVDNQTVDRAVERIKRDKGLTDDQFITALQKDGFTLEEFRRHIREELERVMLIEKVFQSKTIITDADIESYIKTNPEEEIPKVRLSVIFIPKHAEISGEEILKRLRGGADFYELAKKYSKGPNASEGGRVGWVNFHDLAERLQDVVVRLSPGEVSPVLSSNTGDFIVKVEEKRTEKVALNASDPREREKIRRMLIQKEVERKFREWVKGLKERAYIRISL
ncbi:MAG: SurA N-terminal domain-containing protein [Syntrophobacterales bacterium]|nr:SurA N-terminal domain-containing protein [Syntrophobacterales bacterium]